MKRMKISIRKTSKFVSEKVMKAFEPLSNTGYSAVEDAIARHREQIDASTHTPEHIRIIRRLGIKDAERGFNDAEIANYLEAIQLAERERDHPEDFFSDGTYKVGQAKNKKESGPRKPSYNVEYMDQVLNQMVADKGSSVIEKELDSNVSTVVRWAQTFWENEDVPSDGQFRRAIEKKFSK